MILSFQNLSRLVGVEVMEYNAPYQPTFKSEEASTGATDDVDANKD